MTLGAFMGGIIIAYALAFLMQQGIRGFYSMFIRYVLT